MLGRIIVTGMLAIVLGGCNWIGNGYSHVVDKPQREVAAALEDLDFTKSIDHAGPNFDTATGAGPDIRLEKAADHLTWWVMAGDKVAMTMTARFEPIDGGRRTRVTTAVARGNAPDSILAPAFRTTDVATAAFETAVGYRLDTMIDPPIAEAKTCGELYKRMYADNLADIDRDELQADARRRGCPMDDVEPGSSESRSVDGDPSTRSIDRREIVEPEPADDTSAAN